MIEAASVHGRFQPFHNGHLAYVREALQRAKHVHIGITRITADESPISDATNHRFTDEANPFSYFERVEIIKAALEGEGIDLSRITAGPFPIEDIHNLAVFWPVGLTCFTTTVDAWNKTKIEILEAAGYTVEVVKDGAWKSASMASGRTIRQLLKAGDDSWEVFVPKGAHDLIRHYSGRLTGPS